jgi:putative transposase
MVFVVFIELPRSEALLFERGVSVDPSTGQRWGERYAGELESMFRKKHKRCGAYISWRMDETYVKLRGKWGYLYRAVDKTGATIDFMLSKKRNETAAKHFFNKAIGYSIQPEKVTIDKSGSNNAALKSINKYLAIDNKIEIRQLK